MNFSCLSFSDLMAFIAGQGHIQVYCIDISRWIPADIRTTDPFVIRNELSRARASNPEVARKWAREAETMRLDLTSSLRVKITEGSAARSGGAVVVVPLWVRIVGDALYLWTCYNLYAVRVPYLS
jgi:hypothetical protein